MNGNMGSFVTKQLLKTKNNINKVKYIIAVINKFHLIPVHVDIK